MKLNIGGGGRWRRKGWKNLEKACDYDVTERLIEEPDNSVECIYSSHCLEHLTRKQVFLVLEDCLRAMTPGGVIRIVTPDIDKVVALWEADDWNQKPEFTPFWMVGMDDDHGEKYANAHKSFYSFSIWYMMLRKIGFTNVVLSSYGESQVEELRVLGAIDGMGMPRNGFDNRNTIHISVYVEAKKP